MLSSGTYTYNSAEEQIFRLVDSYMTEKKLNWNRYINICNNVEAIIVNICALFLQKY